MSCEAVRVRRAVARLTANRAGVRRVTERGRRWLACDAVLLVADRPVPGSDGTLYYPAAEVARTAPLWDRMPVLLGHPTDPRTGRNVTARTPGVAARSWLGEVRRPRFVGNRLRAEAWLDDARVRRIAPAVVRAVASGRPVEVSTGLFVDKRPGADGRTLAVNHRPDHLAVLVGETGACSVTDGCGLLVG